MKKVIYVFIACGMVGASFASRNWFEANRTIIGSGKNIEKTVSIVGMIKDLEISGSGEVRLLFGDLPQVKIVTDDNVLPYISVEEDGDELSISQTENVQPTKLLYVITLKAPIKELDLSGTVNLSSGAIDLKNGQEFELELAGAAKADIASITAEKIEIEIKGSSQLTAQVSAKELEVEASGSAGVTLAGYVQEQNINWGGAGQYESSKLNTRTTKVNLAGSVRAAVQASERISGALSGASSLRYSREVEDVAVATSGASRLERISR